MLLLTVRQVSGRIPIRCQGASNKSDWGGVPRPLPEHSALSGAQLIACPHMGMPIHTPCFCPGVASLSSPLGVFLLNFSGSGAHAPFSMEPSCWSFHLARDRRSSVCHGEPLTYCLRAEHFVPLFSFSLLICYGQRVPFTSESSGP